MASKKLPKSALLSALSILAIAGGACRPSKTGPHVILISIDTLRADYLGCYGYRGNITPHADRLAAEGVRFVNVTTTAPLTLPGHASMLTGTIPPYHGVHKNENYRLAESNVTLAELLRAEGYTTGAIVSTYILDSQFGLHQGFETYNDELPPSAGGIPFSERRGGATSELACQWLDRNAHAKNLFLFLHYFDPHVEYDPPQPFASQWAGNPYAGEVAYADHCLGRVIHKLKELNLYELSLIILTSDHGEMLNEHGELTHGYFIYESAIKVPLIFKLPARTQRRQVNEIAGLIDIVPTICGLLNVPHPPVVQGQDLSGCLLGRSQPGTPRYLYCQSITPVAYDANPLLGVVGRRWKYIATTRPELYDLLADPQETNNLIDARGHEARLLAGRLAQALGRTSGHAAQSRIQLDAQTRARLESLGYVGAAPPQSRIQLDAQTRARLESLGYVGAAPPHSLTIDPDRDDPKDLLQFHRAMTRAMLVLRPQGKLDEAIRLVGQLVADRPNVYASRRLLARMLAARRRYHEALKHYDAALALHPDDAVVHAQRGYVRERAGDTAGALADYHRAIELDAHNAAAHMFRGRIFAQQGKLAEARDDLDAAIRGNPDLPGLWYLRGTLNLKQDRLDSALADFDQSLARQPDHIPTRMNRGVALARQGKLAQAIAEWTKVIEINPRIVDAYVRRARARKELGDAAGALSDLQKALAVLPPNATRQRHTLKELIEQVRRDE